LTAAIGLEGANNLQILAGVAGIADRTIIPVHVGHGFGTVVFVVGIAIDLVAWDPMLLKVLADFLFAAGGMDDDFPPLALQFVEGLEHVSTRRAQDGGAFPAVVFGDDAVEINGNSASGII